MNTTDETKKKDFIKVRGTATFFTDNTFEFVSQKEGKPQRTNVKKVGKASIYTTTGRDPKRVVTIECKADDPDPANSLTSQFEDLMKCEYKRELPEPMKPKGVQLMNNEDLKMALNKSKKRLEVSFYITLEPEGIRDYKTKFYDKIQEISKCFAINETTIRKSK